MWSARRRKYFRKSYYKYVILISIMCYYLGAFIYPFTLDYESNFDYPLQRNIVDCAIALSRRSTPECPVINTYDYDFILGNKNKCRGDDDINLVIVVKSSIKNFKRRQAIRSLWGHEGRFSDVSIRKIFILGTDQTQDSFHRIKKESEEYGDIVMSNFLDTYYNNTIKTMMSFKWIVTHCLNGKFYLFSDDDMYISIKNILRFVRNPTKYPKYLEKSEFQAISNFINRGSYYELPEKVKLFSGFVLQSSPHRHRCSKWFVSLDEYPYNRWPPYVSGGSYVVSREALKLMYYASYFTKHFKFDDIYLGILAKKLNIEPFHSPEFHVFKKKYDPKEFKYVLSSHGYEPNEMIQIWQQQKSFGNA